MTARTRRLDIVRRRLLGQHLVRPAFERPEAVVAWLGAVQAQDYPGAKWALGVRTVDAADAEVEAAFDRGAILRTHLLRTTWHFVAPADIRWMLALTGPRVHAVNASMYRKLELDERTFVRSREALGRALRDGNPLTRDELREVLRRTGIAVDDGMRMRYLMMRAELDGFVCSGPRRGQQFTYLLLDDLVPSGNPFARDEALAELAGRYFRSRGPARVHDLAKWSGLTVTDAKQGLEAVKSSLMHETVDGETYWFADARTGALPRSPFAHLLSVYDEYIAGYRGWNLVVEDAIGRQLVAMDNALAHLIVIGGRIAGAWKRTLGADTVAIDLLPMTRLTDAQHRAVLRAVRAYGAFLGRRPVVRHPSR